jgi:hypothetical protein
MKTFLKILSVLPVLYSMSVSAQNEIDALRYSQTSLAGTARFISMAGAFSALGGDFSTLSANPAGIAMYRKSEFSFSPSFFKEKSQSNYLGKSTGDNKYNFNFGNAGFVFTYRLTRNDSSRGWKNWNFGLGYNRLNNFHAATTYEGINNSSSMLDYYAEQAQGRNPYDLDPFGSWLAYQTWLINPDSLNNYYSVIPAAGELQRRTWISKGSTGEFALSFGANYSHRFYIGGTLGINSLRYVEQSTFEEIDDNNSIIDFRNFRLNQDLTTTGTGINFKFGMIYRANDFVRVGLAVHTPTFYDMSDEWTTSINSEFDSGNSFHQDTIGHFDYELTTPMKAIAGIGFIIGKMGIISVDYEFIDYSEAKLHASNSPYIDVNNEIHRRYAEAGNLKIGTEWRYETYSFRAGYAMFGTPFASGKAVSGADQSRTSYTAGIGIRDQEYFLDLAYAYTTGKYYDRPYSLSSATVEGATTEMQTHNITLTFGVKF